MGTLRGGNGGNSPPNGDDPSEPTAGWGPFVVPDDLTELAFEAALVRRELRREARRRRWRRRLGSPGLLLIGPLALILAIVFTAGLGRGTPLDRSGDLSRGPGLHGGPAALPALDLLDSRGRPVPLRGLLPAVIMLSDGCGCADLIVATAAAAPAVVSVVVVGRVLPGFALPEPHRSRIHTLADPAQELRASLSVGPPTSRAAVVLVTRSAAIARLLPAVDDLGGYRTDLVGLPTRS